MKWPNSLVVVRHGQSAYNEQKLVQEEDPAYLEFKSIYDKFERKPEKYAEKARVLAQQIWEEGRYRFPHGDHQTPLTEVGQQQAEITGRELSRIVPLPDVILVSPYLRTKQTLDHMTLGWPELSKVDTYEDERLREQEHGLRAYYGDWRIFNVMFPEQRQLREMMGPYWYRHPQGENVPDVRERKRSLLGTMTREYSGYDAWCIAHHLSKLALRANLERFGEEEFLRLDAEEKPVNCGTTIYRGEPKLGKDGRLVLDIYNQRLYPEDLQ